MRHNIPVNIMGIIIAAEECRPSNYPGSSNNKLQHFTFVNNERKPIVVTVWDPIYAEQKNLIMEAIDKSQVVVAKRLRASTVNGISLKTRNSSSLTFDPPLKAATQLKTWFHSLTDDDLRELRGDYSIAMSTDLIRKGGMDIYSVAEVKKAVECRDYWVRGSLQLTDEDQKLFYVGCSNCFSKINVKPGIPYPCIVCKKNVVSTLRPIVAMCVSDATDSIKVIAVQDIAERIIQSTAEKVSQLVDLSPECTEKAKASEYPLSPLKRQLSEIRISSSGGSAKKQLISMSGVLNKEHQSADDENK